MESLCLGSHFPSLVWEVRAKAGFWQHMQRQRWENVSASNAKEVGWEGQVLSKWLRDRELARISQVGKDFHYQPVLKLKMLRGEVTPVSAHRETLGEQYCGKQWQDCWNAAMICKNQHSEGSVWRQYSWTQEYSPKTPKKDKAGDLGPFWHVKKAASLSGKPRGHDDPATILVTT